ncbi:MAG: hypothetical protein ACJ71S_06765 [Acidobacteriaceae bacterium]
MMLLAEAQGFFGECTEFDRASAKVIRQFGSGSNLGLASLVKRNRIASPADFLALENTVYPVANPPDIAPNVTLPNPVAFAVALLGIECGSDRYCTKVSPAIYKLRIL